jgi:outer membrane protein TolC
MTSSYLSAQQEFNVTIIYDRHQEDTLWLQKAIKSEIESLLSTKYKLVFTERFTDGNVNTARETIEDVYSQNKADVLVAAGIFSSQILSARKDFPIPTIAAVNIDNSLLKKQDSLGITSGIPNFTYIQSPFDIGEDIALLSQITSTEKIVLLVNPIFQNYDVHVLKETDPFKNIDFDLITIENDPQQTLDAISDDVDAVYVLSPLNNYTQAQAEFLFQGIAMKKIPSLTLLDYPMLNYGAYAAFSSNDNLRLIRRIALNVSKIADGKDPKDFPIEMETLNRQLIINMETVNQTGVYPSWIVLDNAILMNVAKASARNLSLKSAIAEGLENNLGYLVAQKQSQIARNELNEAKANYLPQLEASSTGLFLDQNTVNNSFGTKGEFNLSAGASMSQLILSEPALANIAIQKLLQESQHIAEKQSELDVVLDVVTAFFNYLQVQSLVDLNNENIKVKQQNLTIAINKENVGYSGESDVYRWETELAFARADFNEAVAQLKTVQFQLNQTLNRPINEDFKLEQAENNDILSELFDYRFVSNIENPGSFKVFADFIVEKALKNLPEYQQMELALLAQERLLKSNSRTLFTPTIALGANYDYPISTVNPGEPLPIPGVDFSIEPTWNAAIVASIPIFNGGSRKNQIQKAKIELYQLQDQRQDLRNKLELQVRSNLEKVQTSFRNLQLNEKAAESAEKNVGIVQDLYNEGQISITSLIDAQNAYLGAEINASNVMYQLIIDLFALERSSGVYLSLATEAQRAAFMEEFLQFNINPIQ